MLAPAVILLLGWMLVPLTMTLWFSFRKYLPLRGGDLGFVGFDNYVSFVSSSSFWPSVQTTLIIVGGVLAITLVLGILLALLLDQPMWGARHCPHPCHCAIFRYANSFGVGLEKYFHGPDEWSVCPSLEIFWGNAGSVDVSSIYRIDHPDRQLAMVTLCYTNSTYCGSISGQRAA